MISIVPPISTFVLNGHTYTNEMWEANPQGTIAAVCADVEARATSTPFGGSNVKDDFFIDGSGSEDDAAAWVAALQSGGLLFFPPGAYQIPHRISATLTKNTKLVMSPDALFVAAADIGEQMFSIYGGGLYSFDVEGGMYDVSSVDNPVPSNDIGTVWDLNNLTRFSVVRAWATAGDTYLDQKGDTFVDAVNCGPGLLINNKVVGFNDVAFYMTGANAVDDPADDGGPTLIANNLIYGCNNGVDSKRRNNDMIVVGNRFEKCGTTCVNSYVGAGEKKPGRRSHFLANVFIDTKRPFLIEGDGGDCLIANNTIVDFGYVPDGEHVTAPVAMQLNGCSRIRVHSNKFSFESRTPVASSAAIVIANATFDGTLFTASSNHIYDNMMVGFDYGIYEGTDVLPQFYHDNVFIDVPSPYVITADSQVGPTYNRALFRVNIPFGIVAPGTVSAPVTIARAGAINGDIVVVTPNTAIAIDARVHVTGRALDDEIQLSCYNGRSTDFDASAENWSILIEHRRW